MKVFTAILDFYVALSLLVFIRYIYLLSAFITRAKQRIEETGGRFRKKQYINRAILDAMMWPAYIFWFGFKSWWDDIKG